MTEFNCKIRNKKTGEVKPAFDCDQTWRITNENADEFSEDWELIPVAGERYTLAIFVAIIFIFLGFGWCYAK